MTCTSDRTERRDAIRELGSTIYDEHGTTAALREFMEVTVDMRPDLSALLLADFNSALDGIGNWKC